MKESGNLKKTVFGKALRKTALIFSVLVFGMLLSLHVSAESLVTVKYDGTLDYDSANSVVDLVNQQRSSAGLSSLVSNSALQNEAMIRAMELAVYCSHTRPDGTQGSLIISNRTGWYGENIAAGYTSSDAVMTGWMNSEGHRANILRTSYKQIGVGCFWHNGIYYWVQLFNGATTSGTLKTGTANVTASVETQPSLLNLYIRQKTSTSSIFSLQEKASNEIYAASTNSEFSFGKLILRADSPALSWSSSGGITRSTNGSSVTVTGTGAGLASVTVACGSATATASITVEHVPGQLSCTEGQSCTACGELLAEAPGHLPDTSAIHRCTIGIKCKRCGEQLEPPSHTPGEEATCTTPQYCSVCHTILKPALGHTYTEATCVKKATCTRCGNVTGTYGAHQWGEWQTVSAATVTSPEKQESKCSVCGVTQSRTVGKKLSPVKKITLKASKKTVKAGKKLTIKAQSKLEQAEARR